MQIKKKFNIRKKDIIDSLRNKCVTTNADFVFFGDSIVSNLFTRYKTLWSKIPCSKLNLGIPGDKIEYAWHRILDSGIPRNSKLVIIHVGTNNIARDPMLDVANGIISLVGEASSKYTNTCFVVSPILPRFDKGGQLNFIINQVNQIVQTEFSKPEWKNVFLLDYPPFLKEYFYSDFLHLVGEGYAKIIETILKSFFVKRKLCLPSKLSIFLEEESDIDFSDGNVESKSDDSHYQSADSSLGITKTIKKFKSFSISSLVDPPSSDLDVSISTNLSIPSIRESSSEDNVHEGFVDLGVESPSISCSVQNYYSCGRVKKNLKNITRVRANTPAVVLKGSWKIGIFDPYSKHPSRLPTFCPYSPKLNRAGERKFKRSITSN